MISCLNGPSRWADYLNVNLFVYIDNDALKLVRMQNVTTTHEHDQFPIATSHWVWLFQSIHAHFSTPYGIGGMTYWVYVTWWRHQMETFPALLALCAGNSPASGEFPSQRPVTESFDVFFDLRVKKRLSKQ